jgi:ABC-type branched-subunit amino acid transport system substrate-binding protein
MGRVVVLRIQSGTPENGFPVSLQIWRNDGVPNTIDGTLPALSNLIGIYQSWFQEYKNLIDYPLNSGITIDETIPTHNATSSNVDGCSEFSRKLRKHIRNQLEIHSDLGWRRIRDRMLVELSNTSDEIRVVIQADDPQLWKLPWHEWDLLQIDSVRTNGVEVAFSNLHDSASHSNPVTPRGKVKILALVDNIPSLQETVKTTIESLSEVIPKYPSNLNELLSQLREGCEILVFAGHGYTGGDGIGRIIYGNSQITVDCFAEALKEAVSKGLKLLFLCCCDNLGLVQNLKDAGVNIPVIIAMREEISIEAAQELFTNFFQKYAQQRQPFYKSFRRAREKLEKWENRLPGTKRIPMIYQTLSVTPPTWEELIASGPEPLPEPVVPLIIEESEPVINPLSRFIRSFRRFVQPRPVIKFLLLMLVGLGIALIIWILSILSSSPKLALCPTGLPQNISYGDKILNENNTKLDAAKRGTQKLQQACTKFGNGRDKNAVAAAIPLFEQAVNDLTTAHKQNTKDAEILTYKNNAEVYLKYAEDISQSTPKLDRPKILAVAIPVNPRNSPLPGEIKQSANVINLGVAIAHKEFNQTQKNNQRFIVLIGDDNSEMSTAQPIIESLKKVQPEIVGVVGHASSGLTSNASKFYNQEKLVLISPSSTAVNIRPHGVKPVDNYIFRICPTNKSIAKKIAEYIINNNVAYNKKKKVIIGYVNDPYVNSLKTEVARLLKKQTNVEDLNLDTDNIQTHLKDAVALVLIPNLGRRESILNWFYTANNYSYQLPVIGSDSMYSESIINTSNGKPCPEGLMLVAPAYNNKVNGILNNQYATIEDWRLPYSYDAAVALFTAANQQSSPQSSQIKNYLLNNLNITGATGQIQFDDKGDRMQDNNSDNIELFRVVKNGKECTFKPVVNTGG